MPNVDDTTWELTAADGSVIVHTGVTGRAARTGHRLTIEMQRWSASVTWGDGEPTALTATIPVDSLQVRSGEGGLTPFTGVEKSVARANAVKTLRADRFSDITFEASSIQKSVDGYHVDGTLTIHGQSRSHGLDLTVDDRGDRWVITTDTGITQSDFGIKPYSQMMGALKVADDVRVTVEVSHTKSD